jgi:DNA-binding IclR family transcriptional regulator
MGKGGLNSIEKAMEVLMAFTRHRELGTGDVSRLLGLHKATASRILRTLASRGFLQQDPRTKAFTLGPAISELVRAYTNGIGYRIVELARPEMERLRDRLGETVVLEVLSGPGTVIACVVEGPQRVRIAGTVGDRLPVHAAAGARAILAFSPRELFDRLIGEDLPQLTPKTITDREALWRELERTRKRGFSLDREEIDVGINAVGAPVFDHEGNAVAAVVVAGPARRVKGATGSRLVEEVMRAAESISHRLHYPGAGEEERDGRVGKRGNVREYA